MKWKAAAGYLTLAGVSLGICLSIVLYSQHERLLEAERTAMRTLEDLGAIVVRDSSQHGASVNLSPLQSRAELEAALDNIADLQWLTSFDASRTPLNDDDLGSIGRLSGLTSLSLAETQITDVGTRSLTELSGLASLNLAQTALTSGALNDLTRLRGLKILDLTGTKVSGDLAVLGSLPVLEWVALRNVTLTDDALPGLARCPALHRVSLEETTFSEKSLQTLLENSPKLVIDR